MEVYLSKIHVLSLHILQKIELSKYLFICALLPYMTQAGTFEERMSLQIITQIMFDIFSFIQLRNHSICFIFNVEDIIRYVFAIE